MKTKLQIALGIFILLLLLAVGTALALAAPSISWQVIAGGGGTSSGQAPAGEAKRPPDVVSYQGYVTVNGSPYTGSGYFKFVITDRYGTTSYWSNDGSSSGGAEPTGAVPLTVTNGMFNVLLGDSPMFPLDVSVFDLLDRYLRVWFSSDNATFVLLAPDRRFAQVPFALQAIQAENADTLDGQHGAFYQQRVGGTCAAGSTVKEVAADGSVTCLPVEPRPGFTVSYPNSEAWGGQYTSITIGANGLGLISYGGLNVLHCDDLACTAGTPTRLDTVGQDTSITLGADGLGLISYYDATNGNLKVAHCSNAACTAATLSTLDSTGDVGAHNSITIGADGLGLISYADLTTGNLKVAHCENTACTTATLSALNSGGDNVMWTSITLTAEGRGLISYFDYNGFDLKVAYCNNTACTTAAYAKVELAETINAPIMITTGADGLGLIAYSGPPMVLRVAHCEDMGCTTSSNFTIDANITVMPSITIGPDGLGLISYRDDDGNNQDLKVAHCRNRECSSADLAVVDTPGNLGWFSSITIGTDGLALISYYDNTANKLKVAHLSNAFGVPYWRRR